MGLCESSQTIIRKFTNNYVFELGDFMTALERHVASLLENLTVEKKSMVFETCDAQKQEVMQWVVRCTSHFGCPVFQLFVYSQSFPKARYEMGD